MIVLPRREIELAGTDDSKSQEAAEPLGEETKELVPLVIELKPRKEEWHEEIEINYQKGSEPRQFWKLLAHTLRNVVAKLQGEPSLKRADVVKGLLTLRGDHHLELIRHPGSAPLYISAVVQDKYQMKDLGIFEERGAQRVPLSRDQFEIIAKDNQSFEIRFRGLAESEMKKRIYLAWRVVIPWNVRSWIVFGALTGLLAPLVPFALLQPNPMTFPAISSMMLAVIAFLAGLRLLVFYDIELLSTWSDAYIFLILLDFASLIRLATLYLK